MFKKTTFTLIAIGVLLSANQSSAQTAKFRIFDRQPAISQGKSCVRRMFNGKAVRNSASNARRAAITNWEKEVRKSLPRSYANWSQAANRPHIRCGFDRIEQSYSCSAVAAPCAKNEILVSPKHRPTVKVKRR